jgi:hypothetical protein
MNSFLLSLLGSIIASVLVLVIDRKRLPELEILMDNSANTSPTYEGKGKWKFIRAKVVNKRMPKILSWFVRQTAEHCRGTVSLFNEADEPLFNMRARWADTPELAYLSPGEWMTKVLFPDPVFILQGESQILDIAVMKEGDAEAFGWNNESYLHDWKTQRYKLGKGKYKVKVCLTTQNGVSFEKIAILEIGNNIESSFFR